MSKPDEITSMVETCASEPGGVDVLANNAGIQHVRMERALPAFGSALSVVR
jgi:NAD(P)-dependent dehydrogenase (short-subunit alcohol dehydrogenase family)